MSLIERAFEVRYRHRVYFTRDVFAPVNGLLREVLAGEGGVLPHKALVTLDDGIAAAQPGVARRIEDYFAAFPGLLRLVCAPVLVEGGERAKNSYFHVSELQSRIERYGLCRHSYLIGVGGGAHLDVAGLAAATAHRGIRHVRVPTTTLAQADSGVGVKNGINAFGKKNFIGAFAPPFAIVNDSAFLQSLPARDKRAGYAEAVKVALIRDAAFFAELEAQASRLAAFEPAAMEAVIARCAALHVEHIATGGDPFEFGSARPLDFGHWAAHKLEKLSEYRLRHGEAVAIGLALDVVYARRAGWLDAAGTERILRLLERLGFELYATELLHRGSRGELLVLEGLEEFRTHLGGELSVTMLRAIGTAVEVHAISPELVETAIHELAARHATGAAGPP